MQTAPTWLPKADRAFMCAAVETARLPQTLRNLSERHERIGATQLKVILGLLYPMGVYHLAALILPIVRMIDYESGFQWDARLHLLQSGALLLPLWALITLITVLAKTKHPVLAALLRCIPLLRRYSKAQALADFAYALGTFINAGVPIQSAWAGATRVANDPALCRANSALKTVFDAGEAPCAQLQNHKVFPQDFIAFYNAGAQNGTLDQMMIKAGQQYQSKANHAMTVASILYPSLLFAAVVGLVICSIFQVYRDYLELLTAFVQ
jgi:type II secretory pathway component PulF